MYTVSHTSAMTIAARIADAVLPGSLGDISAVPDALAAALDLEAEIAQLAGEWSSGALIALGSGPMLAAAEEAHIKIAEASRRQVRHQEAESFLHGPAIQLAESEPNSDVRGKRPGGRADSRDHAVRDGPRMRVRLGGTA